MLLPAADDFGDSFARQIGTTVFLVILLPLPPDELRFEIRGVDVQLNIVAPRDRCAQLFFYVPDPEVIASGPISHLPVPQKLGRVSHDRQSRACILEQVKQAPRRPRHQRPRSALAVPVYLVVQGKEDIESCHELLTQVISSRPSNDRMALRQRP